MAGPARNIGEALIRGKRWRDLVSWPCVRKKKGRQALGSKDMPIYPDIGRAIRNPNRDVGGSIEVDHRCPPNQRWNTVPVGGTGRVIADRKNLPVKFREHATKLHPAGWRPSGEAAYA